MKNLMALVVFVVSIGLSNLTLADEEKSLKEIGLTLGTPSGLNLNLGFWGTPSLPLLVRLSGMYYGDKLNGIQGDVGWAFDREGAFRQYIAATALTVRIRNANSSDLNFTGVGPVYGFNLYGFSLQAGLAFGNGQKIDVGSVPSNIPVSLIAQVGYTFLL